MKTISTLSPVSGPINELKVPSEELQLQLLYFMKLTRELEYRIERKLYRQGKVLGGVYVGRGQEAIAAGACIGLRKSDVICPSHRDMAAFLIRGMSLRVILAQYMGRKTGATRGRDANMHMGDLDLNIIPFISMLGDHVPVAAGAGLAFKARGEDNVAVCFFGDGATSRGDWHEGVNMASVLKLPVVYICNNNQYAYSTPLERQMAVENVADRAVAYGMPGEIVDGNDVLAVWDASERAIARARAGQGPTLIECKTFRLTGHSAHDDAAYVPRELMAHWEERDPILRLERALVETGVITKSGIDKVQERVQNEIDEAIQLAENDPYPDPEDCLKDVYFEQ
ncbi:MAG TPA: thiamine pyrophosphate-dependent dehydrogenase E1 component subunit alpha [Terriglobia bacterium]|nr:thiamine pyrophosphate-dependent dehydrogenase E1 component subunit alpha [Terriglobia bacterium]